ncbi:hypothetical protein B0H12DRAFT_712711 [Mycena haematopus]|nr:hypothetical protein B0H12DRAFT_712711 [Mycena haematopus]
MLSRTRESRDLSGSCDSVYKSIHYCCDVNTPVMWDCLLRTEHLRPVSRASISDSLPQIFLPRTPFSKIRASCQPMDLYPACFSISPQKKHRYLIFGPPVFNPRNMLRPRRRHSVSSDLDETSAGFTLGRPVFLRCHARQRALWVQTPSRSFQQPGKDPQASWTLSSDKFTVSVRSLASQISHPLNANLKGQLCSGAPRNPILSLSLRNLNNYTSS